MQPAVTRAPSGQNEARDVAVQDTKGRLVQTGPSSITSSGAEPVHRRAATSVSSSVERFERLP